MKQTVRSMYAAASHLDDEDQRKRLADWARKSEAATRLRGAVALAQTERELVLLPEQLDGDPWLLNVANGTLDLRTGALHEHRRDDLLTKITRVAYYAEASDPAWIAFLHRIAGGDRDLIEFLQRAIGYSLTGDTSEEVLFFPHGPGATGKSTFMEAVRAVLGEYAAIADFDTFLKRRGDPGVRNDIARLAGARLVVSVEVDQGKQLAEGLIKTLTGGDTVAARHLYRDFFEFRPALKLWLVANYRPRVNANDAAAWRRIVQMPFIEVIPEHERDPALKQLFKTNARAREAILAWAVKGCLMWQQDGLAVPARVRAYTDDYRAENDPLRHWIEDRAALEPDAWTSTTELRDSYEGWAQTSGEVPVAASSRAWRDSLAARGCTPAKSGGSRGWHGISLQDRAQ
jgi:putative DNA primase/helicase